MGNGKYACLNLEQTTKHWPQWLGTRGGTCFSTYNTRKQSYFRMNSWIRKIHREFLRKSRQNSDETKKNIFIEHPSGIPDKFSTEKELNFIENQKGIPDGLPIETKKNWLLSGPLGNPREINLKSWKYNNLGVNGLKKIIRSYD